MEDEGLLGGECLGADGADDGRHGDCQRGAAKEHWRSDARENENRRAVISSENADYFESGIISGSEPGHLSIATLQTSISEEAECLLNYEPPPTKSN